MYKAGFSEIIITPAMDVWLWGYAARNKLSSGIHDDLYVKAFYLSDEKGCEMISITYDTVGIDEQTVLDIGWNINERSGVCNVTVNATHTFRSGYKQENIE